MGSADEVCNIHMYNLFVVANILLFGNDSEKFSGRLRGLSHWKYLMVVYWPWMGYSVIRSAFCN